MSLGSLLYVSEDAVQRSVTQDQVTDTVENAFRAMGRNEAACFPIVRETLGYQDAIFGFKSGFDRSALTLGVKAGGLWPGNRERGLVNHQSTVILFDENMGMPNALVRATFLTSLRTAAASAFSIRYLARKNAKTLGIIGVGGQGEWQLRAAVREREFNRVLIYDRLESSANVLADQLDFEAQVSSPEKLVSQSDVIVACTPSCEPVVERAWIAEGTHFACMGADTIGKQELDESIMMDARCFDDVPDQCCTLGEFQHAYGKGILSEGDIIPLGDVILDTESGRSNESEITIFDSTGMALQDLSAARLAVDCAKKEGLAASLE